MASIFTLHIFPHLPHLLLQGPSHAVWADVQVQHLVAAQTLQHVHHHSRVRCRLSWMTRSCCIGIPGSPDVTINPPSTHHAFILWDAFDPYPSLPPPYRWVALQHAHLCPFADILISGLPRYFVSAELDSLTPPYLLCFPLPIDRERDKVHPIPLPHSIPSTLFAPSS